METEDKSVQGMVEAAWVEAAKEGAPVIEEVTDPKTTEEEVEEVVEETTTEQELSADKEEETEKAEDTEEEEVEELDPIDAPVSWSAKDRDAWEKTPREVQEIIARREAERDKGMSGIAPLKQAEERHKAYLDSLGISAADALDRLVTVERTLRNGTPAQKKQEIQRLIRDYEIEVSQPTEQVEVDPELNSALNPIVNELGELKQLVSQNAKAQEEAEAQRAQDMASRFFDRLTKSELPEARYAEEVLQSDEFSRLLSAERENGRVPDLDSLSNLYTNAAWALPGIREKLLRDGRPKAAETKKKSPGVRTVRKVSSSATGGAGVTVHSKQPPKGETVEQTILRSIQELA